MSTVAFPERSKLVIDSNPQIAAIISGVLIAIT
jgi:hypothetical protein